jgi:hypothetical protein
MNTPWADPTLFLVCFLGLGGSLTGLLGLLLGTGRQSRWVERAGLALMLILLGMGATALALAQPLAIWLPPVGLAGLCAVFKASRSTWAAQVGDQLWRVVRSPYLHWGSLLVASPVLALGYAQHAEDRSVPHLDVHSVAVSHDGGLDLREVPDHLAVTDQGRPVALFRNTSPSAAATEYKEDQQLIQTHNLTDEVIRTGPADDSYNCHGWTFTGGRYWLKSAEVEEILQDNDYQEVATP